MSIVTRHAYNKAFEIAQHRIHVLRLWDVVPDNTYKAMHLMGQLEFTFRLANMVNRSANYGR